MLSPLLIIGLGGAGGKTIRAMKQELNRILESSGYTGGIPDAWQFLQIDTTMDGAYFPAPMLQQDEFHCVIPNGSYYGEILGSIMDKGNVSEQQQMLAGWGTTMPHIHEVDLMDPQIVAGIWRYFISHRAPNRIMSVADGAKTLQAIQRSIAKMSAPTALSELASVANCMGSRNPVNNPQAFIISSLGGGSGSGMFMDVAEILKRATPQNWAQQSISFLYTPDVFRSTGRNLTDIVSKNELLASQWVGISEGSELLYSKMGLVGDTSSGKQSFGCKTNILISGRNHVVDISDGASGAGMVRWNSNMNCLEVNDGNSWQQIHSTHPMISLTSDAETLLDWARAKRDEEWRIAALAAKNPTVADALAAVQLAKEKLQVVTALCDTDSK